MNIKNLALITFSLFSLLMHTSLSAQDLQTVSFDDYLKRFDYKERKNMKIDIPEMLDLYKQGKVQIVDIRFPEEFQAYSFSFIKNIPLNELPAR